jgi:pSer/pThr/pTyr-binding forkhead associated (FHA) protein
MESQATFRLVMQSGPQPDKVFALVRDTISIGRDAGNDIAISDPEISRRHARLIQQPGGYAIEDLGSTNGTFVNGARIASAHQLNHGDQIGLGETVVVVYHGLEETEPATMVGSTPPPPDATVAADPSMRPAAPPPEMPQAPEMPEPYEMPQAPAEPAPPPPPMAEPIREAPEPDYAPPPPFAAEPVQEAPPSYAFEPEPTPPPPPFAGEPTSSPPTPAASYTPPSYEYEEPAEEEPKKSRKGLLIGCGCLLLLLICAAVAGVAKFLWDAPPEFWQDPMQYLGIGAMLLPWLTLI